MTDEAVQTAEEAFLDAIQGEKTALDKGRPAATKWVDDETPASWYAALLIKKYDRDWLEWEPETLWRTIMLDFKTELDDLAKDKVNAAKTLLLTDTYWNDWTTFENATLAFNDTNPNFFQIQVPSPAQMAWSVSEANLMRPGVPFSEEVAEYARIACQQEGLVLFPDELQFAQPDPPGRLAVDIRSAWDIVKTHNTIDIVENELGVNLARLQAVREYVREKAALRG